jgi:DNA ligase D-like protein (predicted polymerase)
VPAGAPDWLETTVVHTPNGTPSRALVLADIAHLAWAVNLGCLGLHVWPYRADDPEHADELRIDLDPSPGVTFAMVQEAAEETRSLLGELGLRGLPKTTGRNGIHVYLRLAPRFDSYAVRSAAVALARRLAKRRPDLITDAWWKEERGRRVFVDFNQNAPHKTILGAWSVRPRLGAQVSTPFAWDELRSVVPDELTMASVPAESRRRGGAVRHAERSNDVRTHEGPARAAGAGAGRPGRRLRQQLGDDLRRRLLLARRGLLGGGAAAVEHPVGGQDRLLQ